MFRALLVTVVGEGKRRAALGCGGDDPAAGLSALWRQCPRETQAMRPRQPNRWAGGAASCRRHAPSQGDARRAGVLVSALGERGKSASNKTTRHHARDTYAFSSNRTERQAVQRWAAGRRSGSRAKRFMAAMSARNSSYAPTAAKSPCRGAARRCAAAFGLDSALGERGASDALPHPKADCQITVYASGQAPPGPSLAIRRAAAWSCAGADRSGRAITSAGGWPARMRW
jgi:hypothetical protein